MNKKNISSSKNLRLVIWNQEDGKYVLSIRTKKVTAKQIERILKEHE